MPLQEIHCPGCQGKMVVQGHLDRFSLRGVSGRGGTGMVYQAHDPHLNRLVALKVVRADKAAHEDVLQQLLSEAGVTASVTHPNVVRVYSVGNAQGRLFIAMELVAGGSLDDLMEKRGRLPEAQVLEIALQIAMGLQAAHKVGLVHRDIKPGNILFSDPRTAKLADFGLAIFEQHAAATGDVWGTPYYMPPERLRREREDLRGDIYALGATLFHALAGRPPFEAGDSAQVAMKRLHAPAPSVLSFAPGTSNATAFVIKKMLEADPAARFLSYGELIESLQFARNELGTKPRAKARVVMDSGQSGSSGLWLAIACLGLLAATGTVSYFMFGGKSDKRSEAAAAAVAAVPERTAPLESPTPGALPRALPPVKSPTSELAKMVPQTAVPAAQHPPSGASLGAPAAIEPGIYAIVNRRNHALDVAQSSLANGGKVWVWLRTPVLNQQWMVKPGSDGTCRLLAVGSFKSLNVQSGRADDDAPIAQDSPNGEVAQRWRFRTVEPGWYAVVAECSGKVLTALPGPDKGGKPIQQHVYTGAPEQQWRLEPLGPLRDNLDAIDPVTTPVPRALPPVKAHVAAGAANPRYVPFDLTAAATADTRRGVFSRLDYDEGALQPQLSGTVEVAGVPFKILDAAHSPKGKNLVVLKGGIGLAKDLYPQRVEIPVNQVALSRLHFVGGVGGWAFPWVATGETDKHVGAVAAVVTVYFTSGAPQQILLRNGYEIRDYNPRGPAAPGAATIDGLGSGKAQIRYFARAIAGTQPVERIVLESCNNYIAPAFFALTGEKR